MAEVYSHGFLNRVARSVVEARCDQHPTHVFGFDGIRSFEFCIPDGSGRGRIGLPHLLVHDLKHTFGRRLRAAGVSFEDRQDLLGHRSGRITTYYSSAELSRLIEAANSVVERDDRKPELVVMNGALRHDSRKTPTSASSAIGAKC